MGWVFDAEAKAAGLSLVLGGRGALAQRPQHMSMTKSQQVKRAPPSSLQECTMHPAAACANACPRIETLTGSQ